MNIHENNFMLNKLKYQITDTYYYHHCDMIMLTIDIFSNHYKILSSTAMYVNMYYDG